LHVADVYEIHVVDDEGVPPSLTLILPLYGPKSIPDDVKVPPPVVALFGIDTASILFESYENDLLNDWRIQPKLNIRTPLWLIPEEATHFIDVSDRHELVLSAVFPSFPRPE
jgi:hypothetical protein